MLGDFDPLPCVTILDPGVHRVPKPNLYIPRTYLPDSAYQMVQLFERLVPFVFGDVGVLRQSRPVSDGFGLLAPLGHESSCASWIR